MCEVFTLLSTVQPDKTMATTYRPKNSSFWYARFFAADGRRISRTTKTESRREAKRIAAEMEAAAMRLAGKTADNRAVGIDVHRVIRAAEIDLEGGTLTPQRGAELLRQLLEMTKTNKLPSFKQRAADWLDAAEKRTAYATWKGYRDGVGHANRILGDKADQPLDRILASDIIRIQSGMKESGLRGKTVNMHMSLIRRIFTAATAKVEPIHDGFRHSFITHRTAETRDVARVADECGNSPNVIKKHYRALVTEAAGKAYFAIRPNVAENVSNISEGRATA